MRKVIVRRVRVNRPRPQAVAGPQPGLKLVNTDILRKFDPSLLDLGDINAPAQEIGAVAAVFDLSGFTSFCNQVDSHLAIPKFLGGFMEWLFSGIRIGLTQESQGGRQSLWAQLPIMVKFLGDGVLLLWNTRGMADIQICKLVAMLYDICYDYQRRFYPQISMTLDQPPSVLRCGVARGRVYSIGNGKDFVGHCINTASRLANLGMLTFCFHHRGIPAQEYMTDEYYRIFAKTYLPIRGLGEKEMVWVVKEEFNRLPEASKDLFRSNEVPRAEAQDYNYHGGVKAKPTFVKARDVQSSFTVKV